MEHDVVVRRRDDGTEVLRVPGEDPTAPGHVPAAIRTELQALSPAEFLATWGVTPA